MRKQSVGADSLLLLYLVALSISFVAAQEPQSSAGVKEGERQFLQSCAGCHDAHSKERLVGPGLKSYYKNDKSSSKDDAVRNIIRQGRGSMPSFGNLSQDQMNDLIRYLRTL